MRPRPISKAPHRKARRKTARQDLSYITGLGASLRSHRSHRDLQGFVAPILGAIVLQSLVYLSFYWHATRNWSAIFSVLGVLAVVPVVSAVALSAFRRHEAHIVIAAVTVASCFSFAVSLLSALRIPMSFAGLTAAFPVSAAIMAMGNIRFHRRLSAHVAMLAFEGDELPLSLLGKAVRIDSPDADIASFDTVLIEPGEHHAPEWSSLLSRCYVTGVDIMPWTTFLEIRLGRVHASAFEVSDLAYTPGQMLYARSKRLLDLCAVLFTLPLTLPLAGLTALYIVLRDGGPVLFVQQRRGFGGRAFPIYKFRTMYKDTAGGATADGDRRVIPGCRFIRKARLDELPQLYNILIGDMSLIGPRPVAEYVAEESIEVEPKYALRSLVPPGITGWAQVTSGYAVTTDEELNKLAYDLYYIKHLSLDLDLQILFRTVTTILFAKGAQ